MMVQTWKMIKHKVSPNRPFKSEEQETEWKKTAYLVPLNKPVSLVHRMCHWRHTTYVAKHMASVPQLHWRHWLRILWKKYYFHLVSLLQTVWKWTQWSSVASHLLEESIPLEYSWVPQAKPPVPELFHLPQNLTPPPMSRTRTLVLYHSSLQHWWSEIYVLGLISDRWIGSFQLSHQIGRLKYFVAVVGQYRYPFLHR